MDVFKLLDLAEKFGLPQIAADIIDGVGKIKDTAVRTGEVLATADEAELDAIHDRALAVNAMLDAKLAEAEKR